MLEKLTSAQSTKWDFSRLRCKVARHFRVNPARLNKEAKSDRTRKYSTQWNQFITKLRQILCYLASEADIPVSGITRELNINRKTVLNFIGQISEQRKSDSTLEELLNMLAEQIDG